MPSFSQGMAQDDNVSKHTEILKTLIIKRRKLCPTIETEFNLSELKKHQTYHIIPRPSSK